MLVAAFQIQVGRPLQIGPAPAFEHKGVGAAAVEPHVENVGHALEILGAVFGAQKFLRAGIVPGVDAAFLHGGDDARIDPRVAQIFAGLALHEQCDRHAPGALARQHPVGPPFHHRSDAVAPFFRVERRVGNRRQRPAAQRFGRHTQRDKAGAFLMIGGVVLHQRHGARRPLRGRLRKQRALHQLDQIEPGANPLQIGGRQRLAHHMARAIHLQHQIIQAAVIADRGPGAARHHQHRAGQIGRLRHGGESDERVASGGKRLVHRHEPLRGAAEDDLCLGAPAVRIAVRVVTVCKQRARSLQVFQDRPVNRIELVVDDRALPAEPRPVGAVFAVALHREHGFQPMRLAQLEIVLAMIGGHMDKAGALFHGDEMAGQERAGAQEKFGERAVRVHIKPLPTFVTPAKAGVHCGGRIR